MTKRKHKDPEREDLPSVSRFAGYSLCPIRYQLELLAPPDKPTKWATAGSGGHKVLAGDKGIQLGRDELDTVEACQSQETDLVSELIGEKLSFSVIRESRLFYLEAGEKLFTGAPDAVYVVDDPYNTTVIPDYKLGFLPVPTAAKNLQMRGQALLAWQNYGSRRVYPAIIQPRVSRWARPALYELDDLHAAREDISALMQSVHAPDAVANPSAEACRHCSAKLICRSAYNPSMQVSVRRKDLVVQLSDETLSAFGELTLQAQMIIDAAHSELKSRVTERPEAFPNWYMQPTGSMSSIDNPRAAFAKLVELIDAKDEEQLAKLRIEFANICKPSITGLVDLVRTYKGLSKVLARAEVERTLGELLVKKPKSPSLKFKHEWETKELVA